VGGARVLQCTHTVQMHGSRYEIYRLSGRDPIGFLSLDACGLHEAAAGAVRQRRDPGQFIVSRLIANAWTTPERRFIRRPAGMMESTRLTKTLEKSSSVLTYTTRSCSPRDADRGLRLRMQARKPTSIRWSKLSGLPDGGRR
jgi:hypothetical protein